VIVVDHVEHVYQSGAESVVALAPTSFTVRAGEFVSLVGPSGSGKTTLLNILAGLITPTKGTVRIASDGVAFGEAKPVIGYMTQQDTLLPWRTALNNVALPLEITRRTRSDRLGRGTEMLRRVGLEAFTHHYPHQLSGGMRQRVSLARALVYSPPVLLLDEPFGALDSSTRRHLHGLLLAICAEFDITVLLVTHDLTEAVALSDRILALAARPGRIAREFLIAHRDSRHEVRDIYAVPELIEIHNELRATIGGAVPPS
jgi:NitT/TauT family transport system ATP-binding protein